MLSPDSYRYYTCLIYSCNASCDLIDFDCKDLFRQLCKIAILAKLDLMK